MGGEPSVRYSPFCNTEAPCIWRRNQQTELNQGDHCGHLCDIRDNYKSAVS